MIPRSIMLSSAQLGPLMHYDVSPRTCTCTATYCSSCWDGLGRCGGPGDAKDERNCKAMKPNDQDKRTTRLGKVAPIHSSSTSKKGRGVSEPKDWLALKFCFAGLVPLSAFVAERAACV